LGDAVDGAGDAGYPTGAARRDRVVETGSPLGVGQFGVRERWGLGVAAAHVLGEALDAVGVVAFDSAGQLNQGLVFVAFNQDISRQFGTIQRRLAEEPMIDYINSVGGGYFFAPPGSRGPAHWGGAWIVRLSQPASLKQRRLVDDYRITRSGCSTTVDGNWR
jgi:hypothetical protein